ncbi:BTAD domain-containing putative transcriptional regulator, partial [Streptosporangium fragile]|uniref:BTAD domain-containing putative transcriptional regulator n=1 Tax=Streptosporangium fragile TaxID=46186 RepID=UPI0031E7A72C
MRFGVLGPLAVWTADGRPVDVPGATVRALLADLLVHAGRPVSADRLAEDLWDGRPPGNPAGALHTKIWQLRRALERAEPGGRELVVSRPPGYLLRVRAETVDAGRFTALADRARDTPDPRDRAALLADALALWRGPAYADFSDSGFARAEITRLEERRLTALEERAEARLELGEHAALADELGALTAEHPLRERLRAAYMLALHRSGRRSQALEAYRDLRGRLREELGLDPGRAVAALHEAMLREDPAVDVPPAVPRPPRLPVPLTGLIGREDALGRVCALLDTGRLVTLTGPGGVGKTRLAIEAARRLGGDFPDGVHLVELAALGAPGDRTSVEDAVASVLGLRDGLARAHPGRPADRLLEALRTRRSLLVLDNCEHVADPAAELAELLLQSAPGLRVLATSQVPLGIPGELVEVVAPLRVPDPDADATTVAGSAAARLFTARAAAAAPGFALDAGNAAAVGAICRRLDGIPLALELAATRVRALGVHELARRLDDRFRLLDTGRRAGPPRQRTLRAMIDWSWEPLTGPERAVLRRLAAHAGGCTLHAAERTCAGDGVAAEQVAGVLTRLVDRSLVTVVDGADGPRYRLLESIAAYCVERLDEAGENEWVFRRHGDHYTALAEEAEPHLRGHDQRRWLGILDAETANLRAALDRAVRRRDGDRALRLVTALAWYRVLRGRLREAARSLEHALSLTGPPGVAAEAGAWWAGVRLMTGEPVPVPPYEEHAGDPVKLARAHWFLGAVLFNFGDRAAGERAVERALAVFRAHGDRWGEAAALWTLGWHALVRCDLAALRRDAEQSHALFRRLGDRWGEMQAADNLAELAEITGDYPRAARLHRDGLRIAEELGLWTDVPVKLTGLGRVALLTGDHARAAEFHGRARRLAAEQSNRFWEIVAQAGLGQVARRQGRPDLAERHLREALDGHRRIGYEPGVAQALAELGFLAEQRGDADRALTLHLEGCAAARATGDPRALALTLEGLAGVRARTGDHAYAARLFGTAAAAAAAVDAPLPPGARGDVDR